MNENVHEKDRGGCSGHGSEKGDTSCDDGDLRGVLRFDDGRRGSRSK